MYLNFSAFGKLLHPLPLPSDTFNYSQPYAVKTAGGMVLLYVFRALTLN
jgi:hypothetical protein